ncbi:MAG: TolC family protein, partial [Alphaproteobacteria bacterium]|nr:TolC family protein [Alphaproteobacteria bacterium]
MRYVTTFLMLFVLSACTLGPDFMRPFTSASDQGSFLNEADTPENPQSMAAWWKRIDDPLLDLY